MSRPRRAGLIAAALAGMLLGAAWVLPPLWDWSRQRDTMEAFATAALGRPVRIDGAIGLTLLPEPMLTAGRVRVLGDARSGELRVGSLRLGVALGPLLHGRVVARELVLRRPELQLLWPLPGNRIALPSWHAGFAGRIEDGLIQIGDLRLRDIQASLAARDDDALSVTGRLRAGGHSWQLAARLGQPAADGTATLEISLTGRDRAQGTALSLSGQLGGARMLQGRLTVQGPDLSTWLGGPQANFRADGKLNATAASWQWQDIALDIAATPAQARAELLFAPTPHARLSLTTPHLALDAWASALHALGGVSLPLSLDISAEAGSLAGGTVRQLRATLRQASDVLTIDSATASVPGEASVRLSGQLRPGQGNPGFSGQVDLASPDPRETLRWLAALSGLAPPQLPPGALGTLTLRSRLAAGGGKLALLGLAATLDSTGIHGDIIIRPGERPSAEATLDIDQLPLDWLANTATWPASPKHPALTTGELRLRADHATLAGHQIDGLVLDAGMEPDRILLRQLGGTADGAQFQAAGSLVTATGMLDGRLDIAAASASPLVTWLPAGWLPPSWRELPDLWKDRLELRAEANGTVDELAVQFGADLGDARLEARPVLDLRNWQATGRASLRHPNARRLLATLGLPLASGPATWPGEGSLSVNAQFNLDTGQVSFDQIDYTAGALRGTGRLGALWRDGVPVIGGLLTMETLPLYGAMAEDTAPLPEKLLQGWNGTILLRADTVLLDDAAILTGGSCALTIQAGTLSLDDCTARQDTATARLQARFDATANPPALTAKIGVQGAPLATPWGPDDAGNITALRVSALRSDMALSLRAAGHSPAALLAGLSGSLHLSARDGTWQGFDLAAARSALAATPNLAETATALRMALAGGTTQFRELSLDGELQAGRLMIRSADAMGPAGNIRLSGQFGLAGDDLDVRLSLFPGDLGADTPQPAALSLALTGPAQAPRRVIDVTAALRWLGGHAP